MTQLAQDTYGFKIQAFTLTSAIQSTALYTPTADQLVHLGGDVAITLNGVAVQFLQGDKIVLKKGITYAFSTDIPLGV